MVYTGHHRGRRGGGHHGGGSGDDNIGNRKRPEDSNRNLPEDIGNRKTAEDMEGGLSDDVGNRLGGPAPWSRSFFRTKTPATGVAP